MGYSKGDSSVERPLHNWQQRGFRKVKLMRARPPAKEAAVEARPLLARGLGNPACGRGLSTQASSAAGCSLSALSELSEVLAMAGQGPRLVKRLVAT